MYILFTATLSIVAKLKKKGFCSVEHELDCGMSIL